ncbi:DUF2127 domain-containing protein [Nakamurella sp.]|uniref:DUF2127 domain-containing protein n=1 Tax=Nakamurella sp. TaxID=1869182 RepID=UPI003B3AAB66
MDWSLRTCGRRGHETFAPDEPDLRARLTTPTPAGEAWRCLRCGDFVIGPPRRSGPADQAPEVPRGRLLRDRVIMRLLAAERVGRALLIALVGVLALHLRDSREQLQRAFDNELALLRPVAEQIGWDIQGSELARGVNRVLDLSSTAINWVAVGLFVYAGMLLVESYGLWMIRRWGEYFSVVVTSVFLPLEIWELTEKFTWLKVALTAVNVAAVIWLVWSKRLFGVRGGGAAYHAEHSEESLLTVERAALNENRGRTPAAGVPPAAGS